MAPDRAQARGSRTRAGARRPRLLAAGPVGEMSALCGSSRA